MEISSAIKLETQTSIESNNEINSEITKLTSLTNPNLQLESNDNKTPTPISFATNDTNASNFSSASKSLSYKSHSGKIRKPGTNYVFKQENIKSYTDTHGIVYNVNDHVYMDINKPNQPFAIACVLDFKLTKRDNIVIEVRWYYRPNEIPDGVYMPLMQDRLTENDISSELIEPIIKDRELFASESRDIYPATFIKGKCRVFHFQDILEAKNFKPFADTFFCILTYNPEARRLANIQGEIRVGASHQAKLPTCQLERDHIQLIKECQKWETCLYKCKSIRDSNLYTYLQASRSIAAFAGMCDKGSMDDMYEAAQSDSTTLHALAVLHEMNYDTDKSLKFLVKTNETAKMLEKKWNEEDQKKFVKGLSQFGKNFFRIRKELLPHKETSQLIEFYYLWKKTQPAQQNRFRRRLRPSSAKKLSQTSNKKVSQSSINTLSNGTSSTNGPNGTTNEQFSGQSDIDSDNDSDESSDTKQQSSTNQPKCCSNCFTNQSNDLQIGGRDSQLLCYDCRMFYKKYGELPRIANEKTTANNKLECNLLKRITEEDIEFNQNCDKECADTIAKNIKETSTVLNKTLTPSAANESPVKNDDLIKHDSPQQRSMSAISEPKQSNTPVSMINDDLGSNCSSPDLSIDDTEPKVINFIFNKPLENIKPDSNAMFTRVWDRGYNTCSRTDVQFKYLPNAKYIRSVNERKAQKESTNNQTNGSNVTNLFVEHHQPQIAQPQPSYQPQIPPQFNFNFKEMFNNPEEFQANLMSKLLMQQQQQQTQPHMQGFNQQQFNLFNNNMNNFHQSLFNKPRPQMMPDHNQQQHQQQQQQQQHLMQMEQMAKMNFNFPFMNNPNHFANDVKQSQMQSQQHQQQQQQQQQQQMPKYPFEFELNPALRQLRDIADKSSLINTFAGLNYFQQ